MKDYIATAKTYATTHKKELTEFAIGAAVVLGVIILVVLVVSLIRSGNPMVVHQPANACELFTMDEAKELLGDSALNSNQQKPVLSGDLATSNCGYADGTADKEAMMIAAIIVRSGINDKGVEQNKSEFVAGTPTENVEIINDIGDKAYFNQALGQLNVLNGRDWIIMSSGVGSAPEVNMLEDVRKLASKVIEQQPGLNKF